MVLSKPEQMSELCQQRNRHCLNSHFELPFDQDVPGGGCLHRHLLEVGSGHVWCVKLQE
jgi:hypothetical protein